LKFKNVLKHPAVNEDMNLSKSLQSSILDDGMLWMYVPKLKVLIVPIIECIFLLEFDKAKISRVPQSFKECNDHFTMPSRKPSDTKGAPSCYKEPQ
jgi:hypothetical protein